MCNATLDCQSNVPCFAEEVARAHEDALHDPCQTSWLRDELLGLFCFCYLRRLFEALVELYVGFDLLNICGWIIVVAVV